ncbi:MAG: right-handed parallel beta-helix repeat-containing protein [Spirochaetota bacterium]
MVTTITPNSGNDIADVRTENGITYITFKKGVHHVNGDLLSERQCFISNNDPGLKRILVDLTDAKHVVVEGNGAELVMHGAVTPFYVSNAGDITIKNICIDWDRPFLSQGLVEAAGEGYVDLFFALDTPFEIRNSSLYFIGDHYRSEHPHIALAFDPVRAETAFRANDHYAFRDHHRAEKIDDRRVRLFAAYNGLPSPGHMLVLSHQGRIAPALAVADSRAVTLENIAIYHAGAMGVIMQATNDITLSHVSVMRRPGSGRVFSTHADATHFVDCGGSIRMYDCLFENQMDDPSNIHGIYYTVRQKLTGRSLIAGIGHHQQYGCMMLSPGDTAAFYDTRTMVKARAARVAEVTMINAAAYAMTFHETLPDLPWEHLSLMKENHDIDVHIKGCTFRNNRARGLLISTLGKVIVEKNNFHVPGAAVLFEGDTNFWFESGPVEDVEIRENVFDQCNYGVWGRGLFQCTPRIPSPTRACFHSNVRIHDNSIRAIFYPLLYASATSGLSFTNNNVERGSDYPVSLAGDAIVCADEKTSCTSVGNRFPE